MTFDSKKRSETIAEETEAFLAWESGDPWPDSKGGSVSFETVPTPLYWYRYVKKWGFPYSGGFMEQPYLFMMDIESVEQGIRERREIVAINKRRSHE